MSCLQAQEVAQQFRLLLELGAEVEGSPAAERLQQLYGIYWAVSPLLLTRGWREMPVDELA